MRKLLILALLAASAQLLAQKGSLPVKEWRTNAQAPLVCYISGDGGLNKFSEALCIAIQKKGYNIVALDARSYFWNSKTPQTAAKEIGSYLAHLLPSPGKQQLAFIGYSFGADVLPFIVGHLSPELKNQLSGIMLIAPSPSTDFEIHVLDMAGLNLKRNLDVIAEINKLGTIHTIVITDSDERAFKTSNITLKNFQPVVLEGNHHFNGNTATVAAAILKQLK